MPVYLACARCGKSMKNDTDRFLEGPTPGDPGKPQVDYLCKKCYGAVRKALQGHRRRR
jgi:hypothetical protein